LFCVIVTASQSLNVNGCAVMHEHTKNNNLKNHSPDKVGDNKRHLIAAEFYRRPRPRTYSPKGALFVCKQNLFIKNSDLDSRCLKTKDFQVSFVGRKCRNKP